MCEIKEEEEEEEEDPMSVDECIEDLSTWMADLAVHQDDTRSAMDRRFDALEARTSIFRAGWSRQCKVSHPTRAWIRLPCPFGLPFPRLSKLM